MKRMMCLATLVCLLLTGCSWMDGNYHSVKPHEDHSQGADSGDVTAANYPQLLGALQNMISSGKEKGVIYVGDFDQQRLKSDLDAAVAKTLTQTPLGAYAVEDIRCELGSSGGKPAVALEIDYRHGRAEIRKIRKVADVEAAGEEILKALRECESSLVLQINSYETTDITQMVEDFADLYPQAVMEVPQVAVGIYPETGSARILELKFTYQNSREDLRLMRSHVEAMFDAAALYISGDDTDRVKYAQLYGFLMERFDYKVETSITPAYSLLRHGVGSSKTFAVVYGAMCRQAGLECSVVTGTCDGVPRSWNIVRDGERFFHVDLLRCSSLGGFREFTDPEMVGYVWDYSAYPACPEAAQPGTGPSQEDTQPTQSETEAGKENF